MIDILQKFWQKQGCEILFPYDIEMGAGTFHPAVIFGVLKQNLVKIAMLQPSRRPQDARFGINPNRVYQHHQFQVILRPIPNNIQQIAIESLNAIGLTIPDKDIRFIEDNWQSPSLGASGLGWEVRCNSMEVLQFTYFQKIAGKPLKEIVVELAYGLKRIALISQNKSHVNDLLWSSTEKYENIRMFYENEWSKAAFQGYSAMYLQKQFDLYEFEIENLLKKKLHLAAYEMFLKLSHTFNLIESGGELSVQQRAQLIKRTRKCANLCLQLYVEGENE